MKLLKSLLITIFLLLFTNMLHSHTILQQYGAGSEPKIRCNKNLSKNKRIHAKRISGEQYNSYFYTISDVIIFAYNDNTDYSIMDSSGNILNSGTLDQDEKAVIRINEGRYTLTVNKKVSYLVGDPVSSSCCGYYAHDDQGYVTGKILYTYGSNLCGNTIAVFAFHDETTINVFNLDTSELLYTGALNKGELYKINGNNRFFKITSNNNVSVLNHDDQGYYVPSNTRKYVGTEFYTFTQAKWTNNLNVIAYYDNTEIEIKNESMNDIVWSGTLNKYEHYSEPFLDSNTFISVKSSKSISVSILPLSYDRNYHHASYVTDIDGLGIGTLFITRMFDDSDSCPAYTYIFSYEDDNEINLFNDNEELLQTVILDKGESVNVNKGKGWYRIKSSKYVSVLTGSGQYSASFVPSPSFFYSSDKEAPKITSVSNFPVQPSNFDEIFIRWETDEDTTSFVYYSVNGSEFIEKSDFEYKISHSLNIGFFNDNDQIKYYVKSIDTNNNETIDNNDGNFYEFVVTTPPDLDIERNIELVNNFYDITITVTNRSHQFPAKNVIIYDFLKGFQGSFDYYSSFSDSFKTLYSSETREITITSIAAYHPVNQETTITFQIPEIPAGEVGQISYRSVPIIFENDIDYIIGSKPIECIYFQNIDYWPDKELSKTFDLSEEFSKDDITKLTKTTDYLILTNPKQLYDNHSTMWKQNWYWKLMVKTNHLFENKAPESLMLAGLLATEKNGVLGYVNSFSPNDIKELLIYNWDNEKKKSSNGFLKSSWKFTGYLLIIGEDNIVPSFNNDYSIRFSSDPAGSRLTATCADNEYADTVSNDHLPDLSVGRMIGDDSKDFSFQLKKSIRKSLQKDDSLLISGTGSGTTNFKASVNECYTEIVNEYNATKIHLSDALYNTNTKRRNAFINNAKDKDLIYYRNHGGTTCWGSWFCTNHVGNISFGSKTPFIFSSACLTGRYKNLEGLGEKFVIDSDALLFYGATERSPRSQNNSFAKYFFEEAFINKNVSVAKAIRNAKRNYGTNNDWKFFTNDEYNLYGDPKIGLNNNHVRKRHGTKTTKNIQALSDIDIVIPNFQVSKQDTYDHTSIPGGTFLLEENRPVIPIYKVKSLYPKGIKIQNIQMVKRENQLGQSGYKIPITTMSEDVEETIREPICGVYPQSEFDWELLKLENGTSELVITIFPFYYDECTGDIQFFKNYSFHVDYISSDIDISEITSDKAEYDIESVVQISLSIENQGYTSSIVVKSFIKNKDDKIVETVNDKQITVYEGENQIGLEWDSSGYPAGKYLYEVTLTDTSGNIIDKANKSFIIGNAKMQINSFNVSKLNNYINPGDIVTINMEFENIGSVQCLAIAYILIKDDSGKILNEYSKEYNIQSQEKSNLEVVWDTNSIEIGNYAIIGHVSYNNTTTKTMTEIIKTYQNCSIKLETDKDTYNLSEKVLVEIELINDEGLNVEKAEVQINVIRPDKTFFSSMATYRSESKKYIYSFTLSPLDPSGFYTIEVIAKHSEYNDSQSYKTISLSKNPVILIADKKLTSADGKSYVSIISQNIMTTDGTIIDDGVLFTVTTTCGQIILKEDEQLDQEAQIPINDGKIEFSLKSTWNPGIAEIKVVQDELNVIGTLTLEFQKSNRYFFTTLTKDELVFEFPNNEYIQDFTATTINPEIIDSDHMKLISLPFGIVQFQIKTSADTALINIYFPKNISSSSNWYQYSEGKGWEKYGNVTVNDDRNMIQLIYKDGQVSYGDSNDIVDDTIKVLPSGVGTITSSQGEDTQNDEDEDSGNCFIKAISIF